MQTSFLNLIANTAKTKSSGKSSTARTLQNRVNQEILCNRLNKIASTVGTSVITDTNWNLILLADNEELLKQTYTLITALCTRVTRFHQLPRLENETLYKAIIG